MHSPKPEISPNSRKCCRLQLNSGSESQICKSF